MPEREPKVLILGQEKGVGEALRQTFQEKGEFEVMSYLGGEKGLAKGLESKLNEFEPTHSILTSSKDLGLGDLTVEEGYEGDIGIYTFKEPDLGSRGWRVFDKGNPADDYGSFREWIMEAR